MILFDDRSAAALPPDATELISRIFASALRDAALPDTAEISISFVTPDEIRTLNREYRSRDAETDVLSFPFCDVPGMPGGPMAKPSSRLKARHARTQAGRGRPAVKLPPLALGDIVICPAVARAQAEAYGHSYERETAFLAVHGLLHLLGHDHENPEDEQRMRAAQEDILNKAGIFR